MGLFNRKKPGSEKVKFSDTKEGQASASNQRHPVALIHLHYSHTHRAHPGQARRARLTSTPFENLHDHAGDSSQDGKSRGHHFPRYPLPPRVRFRGMFLAVAVENHGGHLPARAELSSRATARNCVRSQAASTTPHRVAGHLQAQLFRQSLQFDRKTIVRAISGVSPGKDAVQECPEGARDSNPRPLGYEPSELPG